MNSRALELKLSLHKRIKIYDIFEHSEEKNHTLSLFPEDLIAVEKLLYLSYAMEYYVYRMYDFSAHISGTLSVKLQRFQSPANTAPMQV